MIAPDASPQFNLAIFLVNVLSAGVIAACLIRLPRRLDGSRAGEMTARQALGLPPSDNLPATRRSFPLGIVIGFLAVCLIIGFFQLLPPLPDNASVPLLVTGVALLWVAIFRQVRQLHEAASASRPALGLFLKHFGAGMFLLLLPVFAITMISGPFSLGWISLNAVLLTMLACTAGKSLFSRAVGVAAILTFAGAAYFTAGAEPATPSTILAAESAGLLTVISTGGLLLLFRRIPREATPRLRISPPPQQAPAVS